MGSPGAGALGKSSQLSKANSLFWGGEDSNSKTEREQGLFPGASEAPGAEGHSAPPLRVGAG